MKHLTHLLVGVLVAAVMLAFGTKVMPQEKRVTEVQPINDLPNPYETMRNWGDTARGADMGIDERGQCR